MDLKFRVGFWIGWIGLGMGYGIILALLITSIRENWGNIVALPCFCSAVLIAVGAVLIRFWEIGRPHYTSE